MTAVLCIALLAASFTSINGPLSPGLIGLYAIRAVLVVSLATLALLSTGWTP
jgi:hypothetical protein